MDSREQELAQAIDVASDRYQKIFYRRVTGEAADNPKEEARFQSLKQKGWMR